ncbi:MAG: hypothetical protein DWQ07_25205 [Chloroflexi bacterium]|nr:MAG: hypothetical protein DWQ07_25205 [Chloroflexota bacterium]MBL1196166.1 hypothetical protein [Chloroflexota bacterium]NOH13459.1 hypothetical protein [Chloroflexota bacterium]
MPSISDRLKSMGVNLGSQGLSARLKKKYPLEQVVDGELRNTPFGDSFVLETVYPFEHEHGKAPLQMSAPMEMMAAWGRDERVATCEHNKFAFLDTETTGLASGSGTYAFLIGVGRFEDDGLHLAQFFMRDPAEEPAQLALLDEFLSPCETVVTFNGKSFDIPLLNARYITNGERPPLADAAHLDLLHLARRLWRERLPSRALGDLEVAVLEHARSEEDVPGWMIPQMYFNYLRDGDARPMKSVLYHNAEDILSMVVLLDHMAAMLAEPLNGAVEYAEDLLAVGRLYEDLGFQDQAAEIMESSLKKELPQSLTTSTMERLAVLHRRRGDITAALSLWYQAAADGEVYAHVELAKHYEHRESKFDEALRWTEAALAIVHLPEFSRLDRYTWQPQLEHRQQRLQRRLKR